MNIQERLNLERENVQLKKELSVLKEKWNYWSPIAL